MLSLVRRVLGKLCPLVPYTMLVGISGAMADDGSQGIVSPILSLLIISIVQFPVGSKVLLWIAGILGTLVILALLGLLIWHLYEWMKGKKGNRTRESSRRPTSRANQMSVRGTGQMASSSSSSSSLGTTSIRQSTGGIGGSDGGSAGRTALTPSVTSPISSGSQTGQVDQTAAVRGSMQEQSPPFKKPTQTPLPQYLETMRADRDGGVAHVYKFNASALLHTERNKDDPGEEELEQQDQRPAGTKAPHRYEDES